MKLSRSSSVTAVVAASVLTLTACGSNMAPAASSSTSGAASSVASSSSASGSASTSPMTSGAETSTPATSAPAAGGTSYTPMPGLSGSLKGAGASSQGAAMDAWIAEYGKLQSGVTVNYDGVGSGAGREQMIAGSVNFAGSDAYMKAEELEKVKAVCGPEGVIDIPVYISPIAVPFKLEGINELNLKPATLAKIFDGKIATWNDPAIAADNPGVTLPDTAVVPVHRSDASGTTENFMDYLSEAAASDWTHEAGKDWPIDGGESGEKTAGVIQVVQSTEGAIGYADASATDGMTSAKIGVGDTFVAYSPEAAAAVVDSSKRAEGRPEGDLAIELAHDTTASGVYPIVLVSYHIACKSYQDEATANMVKDFLSFVVTQGQTVAQEAAGSAPISAELAAEALASISSIKVG